jgi:hypothetical protein
MNALGRRVLYLRTLDIDREQFWALLIPFMQNAPTEAEAKAWYDHGELPQAIAKAADRASEELILKDQFPRRR